MALAIHLPTALAERLREKARNLGLEPEVLAIELLADALNPDREDRARAYWSAAEHMLMRAEEELSKGELRQASEKIWGAAALATKALAYERDGRRLASHGEMWEYVGDLASEAGDEELGLLWRSATSMHVNFYEGWAPASEVRRALDDVRELIRKLRGLSRRTEGTGGPQARGSERPSK